MVPPLLVVPPVAAPAAPPLEPPIVPPLGLPVAPPLLVPIVPPFGVAVVPPLELAVAPPFGFPVVPPDAALVEPPVFRLFEIELPLLQPSRVIMTIRVSFFMGVSYLQGFAIRQPIEEFWNLES
jgi:hypothetical protein